MSWRDEAACRAIVAVEPEMATAWDNIDHDDHYEPDPQEAIARQACFSCPVREKCLREAIADPESEGIRGGYRFHMGSVDNRDALKIKREFNLKVKVLRRTSTRVIQVNNVQSPEVP